LCIVPTTRSLLKLHNTILSHYTNTLKEGKRRRKGAIGVNVKGASKTNFEHGFVEKHMMGKSEPRKVFQIFL
jgi:hypothetical protein